MGLRLHTRQWGAGGRAAYLLHGMMADSRTWWRVAPALVARGYAVTAVDLPGHGLSEPMPGATPERVAEAVVESLPAAPELALGHSLGAVALALAIDRLCPGRVAYAEPSFRVPSMPERAELTDRYEAMRRQRTPAALRRDRPGWTEGDRAVEVDSARCWDVRTSVDIGIAGSNRDFTPSANRPSLVLLADPSEWVPPAYGAELRAAGFTVRVVDGATHSIHYNRFNAFMAALDEWLGCLRGRRVASRLATAAEGDG